MTEMRDGDSVPLPESATEPEQQSPVVISKGAHFLTTLPLSIHSTPLFGKGRSKPANPTPIITSNSPELSPSPVNLRDRSPSSRTPRSSTPRSNGVLGGTYGTSSRLETIQSNESYPMNPDTNETQEALLETTNGVPETPGPGRKNVQFTEDTQNMEQAGADRPPPDIADRLELQSRAQSFYSRLRALAHTRSASGSSIPGRSSDPKDLDGALSPRQERNEPFFSMTLEGDGSEADADAEESAAEGGLDQRLPRKRRKKTRRIDEPETAPSSPHSPIRPGFFSTHSMGAGDHFRPDILHRSATETDLPHGRQGISEDEGRKMMGQESPWRRRHPFRGLSYGGQRKTSEVTPEGRRPMTLLNFAHISSHGDGSETPKQSRTRMIAERGSTLSAQKWKQLKASLKLLAQGKKKERTIDHQKSAELLAELSAGTPAALILASMFQRDEHGSRRIPILLEQLKVSITDSEVDKSREVFNPTPGDRHLIFRIELEYGNGVNRMKWVIKRSLRDFANLHVKYKLHFSTEKLKGRGTDSKRMPKFPKSAFPYLKAFRGLEDEEDEDDEPGNDTEGATTDNEKAIKPKRRSSFSLVRRKSSLAGEQDVTGIGAAIAGAGSVGAATVPAATRRDPFPERQRKKLELYLQRMIKFMLFRPDSNRLCKFLEVSALGMRLAAEGSYHGKEGFLVIQSAKGLDFRKALTPGNIRNRHAPKWFLVRHSYVVCVDSPEEMHIYDVFMFDSEFTIHPSKKQQRLRDQKARDFAQAAKESAKHPQHHRLKLQNSERKLKLLARNERQLLQFEESIRSMVEISPWAKKNRFDSFAPVRPNCFAQWLVDGRDYMWVVSRAINQAKDAIYIHGWWLSPEIYMRRPPAISGKWRLDRLLKRKAEEGVKIFVIVYRNIESAIPIDSQYTKFSLLELHHNVFVQRSPNQFRQNTFFWAHHEKVCIVDHIVAFVGGIDLCFGRWDTPQHTISDDKPTGFEPTDIPRDADHIQMWPGKDYSNPRVQDFYALNKPYEEMYDRSQVARMPWHDVAMQVVGQPARDLTRHFVQRWNYILRQRKPTRPTPFLLPPPEFNPADLEALGLDGTCEVQILRSAGPWSLGTPDKTEHSIMNAYVKLIEESDHFVYIENQFFISSCETDATTVNNLIGSALVERIIRAAKNDEAWRACIIIPLIPGFQNTVAQEGGTSVRLIMQYQYRSICRGESSIFGRLRAQGIDPEDYIQFYALRTWGKIGPQKILSTEQLYIHAKCMVVDDRVAIIGSANINERSMLGNRDSECAAVVRDTDMFWSRMNGEPYQVGRFAHSLRMRLMREHLGLDVDAIMEEAQVMEANRRKLLAERARSSSVSTFQTEAAAASAELRESWATNPPDGSPIDARNEVLLPSEKLKSFNHDVDWEQAENPNLKSTRRLTEDPRVTGNAVHQKDVDGEGADHMAELEKSGCGDGRDTALVRGKEILVSDIAAEGKATLHSPVKRGEKVRRPSYVARMEVPNPPMPPRPAMDRLSTAQLGLPLLSQLPALPDSDDADIGGPSLNRITSKSSTGSQHPLANEIRRASIDRDCMQDPLHDAFMYDTWNLVAENNTKIFRAVFRCMPDNEVKGWKEYHAYLAYEERFRQMQAGFATSRSSKASPRSHAGSNPRSGPPGAGTRFPSAEVKILEKVSTELGEKPGALKEKVTGQSKEEQEEKDKENLRNWAADANRAQLERQQSRHLDQDALLSQDEKGALKTVPEDPADSIPPLPQPATPELNGDKFDRMSDPSTDRATSSPSTTVGAEKTSPKMIPEYVGYSGALNMNSQPVRRRRRRATTRSSRREFSAADDILTPTQAEELLELVQGNLVLWPYDWLERVEAGGNWLYSLDQISPIEIYI